MPVALVTGGSRGVGRGVVLALVEAGFRVFATGRSILGADLPDAVQRLPCDHLDDEATVRAFAAIGEAGLDLLVNACWGGYERMVENGAFTWTAPFWQQPLHRWTSMIDGGVRPAFVCSAHAARTMVPRRSGLIVNISFWAAQRRIGNTIYGIAKAATDKMTADMADELRAHNVSVVSLYPGLVRTEAVLMAAEQGVFDLSASESPQFIGRVIAALYAQPDRIEHSGRVLIAAAIAAELGIKDIDGRAPPILTASDL